MPKPKSSKGGSASASQIKDARFASFETDPRYQLPSKKNVKTKLDKRFRKVLEDDEFIATTKVDRYGRKLKSDSKKKALERLYVDEDEEEEEEEDLEVEDDDIVRRELEKAEKKYDPAREGGFASSSEDDSDSDSDSESGEPEVDDGEEESRPGIRLRKEKQEVQPGELSHRIAVVNIDWDNIKSVDLMALFSSFVPAGGRIEKVSVYPSEFGKSRMEREEMEGPPKEIFKKFKGSDDEEDEEDSSDEDDSDNDDDDEDSDEEIKKELLKDGNDEDFDSDALRTYQLDRLRYYYAVVVCSDKNTAHKIYEATDGTEYLSSSNFLDLRFIPDDVTFDDEPRDECKKVPMGYKPVDFVTDALQHSKVKLTWDMHPEENTRSEALKKAFSGSRAEIADNDLRAYLASDSSDEGEEFEQEEEEVVEEAAAEEEEKPLSKKELERRKLRAKLGLPEEPTKSSKTSKAPVGEMQITFAPALSSKVKEKEEEEETTIEKYKRRERERKEAKRVKALAKREGRDPDAFFEQQDSDNEAEAPAEDLGFDDPFFTSEPVEKSNATKKKEDRKKKRAEKEQEEKENAARRAELELLMADDKTGAAGINHFDMREVERAEKLKGKKGKKGKKVKGGTIEDQGGLQEDFDMDVEDPRFKAVFESHEFAIDPSNPKFKATAGMKKLLEVGRKKRKAGHFDDGVSSAAPVKSKKVKGDVDADEKELGSLVESIKRKAKARR
ncbi:putative Pre-rRNA-processing protein ESF1 [Podospora fimiseda]|uniref:Pre-rRNA-processing protein ESF1 n=1 Tax=Podospora fimiseda TaxID=252190 RepID=A0AAN7BSA4_9PEZI|nr:putative Pre-rRNA-processing protein ESF1 [Podospora fimiseda]